MKPHFILLAILTLTACSEPNILEQMKDCETVSPQHVQNILDGMKNSADVGKFSLDGVQAIRSKGRENIYFVSGKLTYTLTNADYGIGTWVLNSIDDQSSIYWAMPGPATETTVYPDATKIRAKFSE